MARFGIVAVFVSAALLHTFVAADQLSEFRRRCGIVEKLDDLYEEFVAGRETKDNLTLQNSFESFFQDKFDDSDQWMMNAFIGGNEFASAIIKETEVHYAKVEKFYQQAETCVRKAFAANMHYEDLQGSDTDAIEEEMETVHTMITSVSTQALQHIKEEAWKEQFPIDVENINRRMAPLKAIYKFLKEKYPFRNWMVVDYSAHTPTSVCTTGPSYTTRPKGVRHLSVYQSDAERKSKGSGRAQEVLDRIPESDSWRVKCQNEPDDIRDEANYRCSDNLFTLFAVYKLDGFPKPEIASGDQKVFEKFIYRRSFGVFCKNYYLAVIIE